MFGVSNFIVITKLASGMKKIVSLIKAGIRQYNKYFNLIPVFASVIQSSIVFSVSNKDAWYTRNWLIN